MACLESGSGALKAPKWIPDQARNHPKIGPRKAPRGSEMGPSEPHKGSWKGPGGAKMAGFQQEGVPVKDRHAFWLIFNRI